MCKITFNGESLKRGNDKLLPLRQSEGHYIERRKNKIPLSCSRTSTGSHSVRPVVHLLECIICIKRITLPLINNFHKQIP